MATDEGILGNPSVSVIIPHYQDLGGLAQCLDALDRQTMPRDAFEIVVSDNASPVGAAAVAEVIAGRARLVICETRGAGPTRNHGVAAARGDILAFIDSDCVAKPGWLAAGVAGLEASDIVGGHVSVSTRHPDRLSAAEAYEAVFAFDMATYISRKGFAGSGNLFVPRRIFEAVGGFGAKVSEDVDWSHRAQAAGYTLAYSREAEVAHPARVTWPELRRKFARVHEELIALARTRGRGGLPWLLRTWAMPLSAVAHTPRVLRSAALPNTASRVKAVAMLYRLRLWRFVDGHRVFFRRTPD